MTTMERVEGLATCVNNQTVKKLPLKKELNSPSIMITISRQEETLSSSKKNKRIEYQSTWNDNKSNGYSVSFLLYRCEGPLFSLFFILHTKTKNLSMIDWRFNFFILLFFKYQNDDTKVPRKNVVKGHSNNNGMFDSISRYYASLCTFACYTHTDGGKPMLGGHFGERLNEK